MFFLPLLIAAAPTEADTLRNINIEEAVVVASPKETKQLREQPVSVSLFDADGLRKGGVENVKGLSALAPNFYMPSYGSRLTSAVYIRGIGSRINTPAVGLYVDNVPYVDKTAYDFAFPGVERVDVLRGPQGTLYGRNTMGGLIRVFTANPMTHHGTDIEAGIGTALNEKNTLSQNASFTTFLHPSTNLAMSVGAYYTGQKGHFTNSTTGKKQDRSQAGGGRFRLAWRPTDVVKIDWTASYELSNEGACPYYLLGRTVDFPKSGWQTAAKGKGKGVIEQNEDSRYRRSLLNTGLNVEHRLPRFTLTSITAFQRLDDRLFMDNDFTKSNLFTLEQKQRMSTLSEEIALKSPNANSRWTWTTGVFAMYQWLRTTCPVTFYDDGVSYLNEQIAANLPQSPQMSIAFTGDCIPFASDLRTPSLNAALFHQSTVRVVDRLSLTLGLRVDYDHRELRLSSDAGQEGVPYNFSMSMGQAMSFNRDFNALPTMNETLKHDSWQFLPKAALNYSLPRDLGNIYVSVAKGYRSGGYNIQSYSDLSQQLLRRCMMTQVGEYSVEQINAIPYLPDAAKEKILASMNDAMAKVTPDEPKASTLYYKPEYTWSYEAGIHHNLAGKLLQLDLSAFYMKTRDQQIARFSESGMGRVMVNAGRSRSVGAEFGLRSQFLSDRLIIAAAYGLTRATFTSYDLGTSSSGERIDYTGNRVPFVPEHTMSASADFTQPLSEKRALRNFTIGGSVKGAGNVMWNEANTFSQPFYATLALHAGITLAYKNGGKVDITVWGDNLTQTRYATFAFDSMGNRFAQYGTPARCGVKLKWHF